MQVETHDPELLQLQVLSSEPEMSSHRSLITGSESLAVQELASESSLSLAPTLTNGLELPSSEVIPKGSQQTLLQDLDHEPKPSQVPMQVTESEQPRTWTRARSMTPRTSQRKRDRKRPKSKQVKVYTKDWKQLEKLVRKLELEGVTQADRFEAFLDWVKQQMHQVQPSPSDPLQTNPSAQAASSPEPEIPQLLGAMTTLTQQLMQQQQQQAELTQMFATMVSERSAVAGTTVQQDLLLDTAQRPATGAAVVTAMPDLPREEQLAALSSKELKASRLKGSAQEKLRRAYDAMLAHNNAPERLYEEKWVINQATLADLTGCNRPAIHAFMDSHGEEIKTHHQHHYLRPRHKRGP